MGEKAQREIKNWMLSLGLLVLEYILSSTTRPALLFPLIKVLFSLSPLDPPSVI